MMPAVMFMIGVPVAIAAILAVVALSGRMPQGLRNGIMRGAVLLFYPMFIAAAVYNGWAGYVAGEWLNIALSGVTAVSLAVVGVKIWQNPSLRRDNNRDGW